MARPGRDRSAGRPAAGNPPDPGASPLAGMSPPDCPGRCGPWPGGCWRACWPGAAGPALAGLAAAPALAGRGRHPPVPADRPEYPADSDWSTGREPRAHPDPAGRMTAADHSGTGPAGTGPAGPEVAGPAAAGAALAGAAPTGAGRAVHPAGCPAHAARPAHAGRWDPVARAGPGLVVRTGHHAPAAGPGAAAVRDRQAARSPAEGQVRRARLARQGRRAGRTACRAGSARCPAAARSLLACRSARPRSGRCRSGSFRPTRPPGPAAPGSDTFGTAAFGPEPFGAIPFWPAPPGVAPFCAGPCRPTPFSGRPRPPCGKPLPAGSPGARSLDPPPCPPESGGMPFWPLVAVGWLRPGSPAACAPRLCPLPD